MLAGGWLAGLLGERLAKLIVLDSGSPPGGGAQGSGGAVGSCGWIPLGGGPWVPAGRMIQSLDSAPALWFDSLADCVSPMSPREEGCSAQGAWEREEGCSAQCASAVA